MDVKLVWSKRADQGYARIIKYLEEEWTDKEVSNFVRETKHFFELLKENPHILEPTRHHKNLYRGPINRLTLLTYRFNPKKKEIILINIREARKKPLKE
jgi:plasmid stabilization system protein ParE